MSLKNVVFSDIKKEEFFNDTLYIAHTKFSTLSYYEKNRADNIKRTVKAIDGIIISSGDVFSFNKVVGPRTLERGYKKLLVYFGGKVVEGLGGV